VPLAAERQVSRPGVAIDSDSRQGNETPGVANLGLARPPLIYLGSILAGLLLDAAWPLPLTWSAIATPIGVAVVFLAVGLFIASVRAFRAAGTPVPGNRPTTRIVRTGPYRFSRNPIYLAFSLLHLGLSLWVGSLWLLVTLVVALAVMSSVVIPREERYLEARFPSDYLPYKASVRRWL
jgi:protein-S-isoprenylcysteine O-methyltransferase Ste14